MSMTVVNAKIYVADILGGRASQQVIDRAAETILRAYQDWDNDRFWQFLLKDTSATTPVTGCTATATSAVVNAPTVGAFDFVNVGQTVTISAGTATLAASTTVLSYVRGLDGVITSITLSAAFGGTTNVTATLTFSADIPILVGVDEYNLPLDWKSAYSARMLVDPKGAIQYIDQKYWDKVQDDQTIQLPTDGYMIYNPVSAQTQNFGVWRLKLTNPANAVNTLRLRYYRTFITNGTNIDIPDAYLYKFLDYARGILLQTKHAQDDPSNYMQGVNDSFEQAQQNDAEPDDDEDQRMKSPYEMNHSRPIVGNGAFNPFPEI